MRVLDNFSTGSRANLAGLEQDVEVVEGELRSYERVHNAVRGAEVVFHLGALGSVPRSVQDPLTSSAVNVEGTLNVLLAARDEGVRRVVFASSSSVYGNAVASCRCVESQAPDPISPYGVAKLAAERYCMSFSRVYESFETVVAALLQRLRPAAGPDVAVRGGRAALHHRDRRRRAGDDLRRRRAVARLHLRRQRRRREPPRSRRGRARAGEILNVAGGAPTTVNALADAIGRLLGKPVETPLPACPRPATCANSWADVSEARRLLGFEPQVELEEGLRRTADFLLDGKEN